MSEKIMYLNADSFDREVLQSPLPVIVDFYSEECPPCEVLAPIYEKMAQKYSGHIKFVKILRQDNREFAKSINVTGSPTVLFYQNGKEIGQRLTGYMSKPQVRQAIESILGDVLPKEEMKEVSCDILILGAGAAGLSAAIYASRAKMNTVVLDESVPGGQTAATYHVENYPGTPGIVRGTQIIGNMREQATHFGAKIEDLKEIFEINLTEKVKTVRTEDTTYLAKAVIIASGAKPRALPAKNADEFKGRGIHYCATCDGSMYQDRKVVVVGSGNSAVEEALFLTRFASHVTIVNRSDRFKAAKLSQDEVFSHEKIDVVYNAQVQAVNGHGHALTSIEVEDTKTGEHYEIPTEGAFVYIGTEPATKMYEQQITLDEWGYIVAGEDTKTTIEGVFVAGDIRTKPIRQVVTAASDGAVAGIMAEKFITANHH